MKHVPNIFLSLAYKTKFFFPNLERHIIQSGMKVDPVYHLASSFQNALFTSALLSGLVIFLGIYTQTQLWIVGVVLFPILLIFSYFTGAKGPERRSKRRVRELEKELPYALRHILIEVKSGIPLYNSMVSVSEGYGEISSEFGKMVKQISTGTPELEALEESILRNPSLQYRRSIWQIISAIEAGANISSTLESLVESIVDNQILDVRKYGRELNPYTLIYMLVGVIIPSLGITFLMILSTFTGINTTKSTFYFVLGGLALFNYFFITFVKSKRPVVKS